MIKVDVRDNDVEQAIKRLKKVLNREGVFRKMREKEFFEKPFEARNRMRREAVRRSRKSERERRSQL